METVCYPAELGFSKPSIILNEVISWCRYRAKSISIVVVRKNKTMFLQEYKKDKMRRKYPESCLFL